jgi:hypothetical protein
MKTWDLFVIKPILINTLSIFYLHIYKYCLYFCFYCKFFIRIYSLYRGGFILTILIGFILYISYITLIVCPPQPSPNPLKAITRGFFVLLHTGIWSPSVIYHHLNLLHSPPLSTNTPPLYLFYSLVFFINI